ncbi:MAG: ATP-binding cassette domain-containing protein, partial [Holosporales bacterium]|nr:ATP-binding cassette domain-containing protein [Holosporales bacterium]
MGMKAEKAQGSQLVALVNKKQEIISTLGALSLPEEIHPTFSLPYQEMNDKVLVSITDGAVGYAPDAMFLQSVTFSVRARERVALIGNNGSGKTTLMRAILGDPNVVRRGEWRVVSREDMGHLDQHYDNLSADKTVLETIASLRSSWSHAEVRQHLNDFLFRKNEEVQALVCTLSGGEKARLSLAKIAAYPPKLLLLDEITNNVDLETWHHLVSVLQN